MLQWHTFLNRDLLITLCVRKKKLSHYVTVHVHDDCTAGHVTLTPFRPLEYEHLLCISAP